MVGAADEARRKALEEEDAAERLRDEQLKSRVPDLRIAERSPAVVFAPILLSVGTPYQLGGIGSTLDLGEFQGSCRLS